MQRKTEDSGRKGSQEFSYVTKEHRRWTEIGQTRGREETITRIPETLFRKSLLRNCNELLQTFLFP